MITKKVIAIAVGAAIGLGLSVLMRCAGTNGIG